MAGFVSRWLPAAERILLTLWVGGLWVTGYLVLPSLFASLDSRQLAGELAGNILTLVSWLGLACGGLLLLVAVWRAAGRWRRAWRVWVLATMLVFIAVGLFVLQPQMMALKAQGIAAGSAQAAAFGRLHGISSVLYLLNSILGLVLVGAGVRPSR